MSWIDFAKYKETEMTMEKRKIIFNVSMFILIFIGIYGLLMIAIIPLKNQIRDCEEKNWDGSEFEMPREPFTGKASIAKCNKEKENNETDVIIELLNSLPFSGKDIGE